MAGVEDDFLYGDNLDTILSLIDRDILEENNDLSADITSTIKDIPSETTKPEFSCELCVKSCLTKRGLNRHMSYKHKDVGTATTSTTTKKSAEQMLHPIAFKKMIESSLLKLIDECCYPDNMIKEWEMFTVGNLDKVNIIYHHFKEVIQSFNGNAEKFYPRFYKCVTTATNLFPGLSMNCSRLLGFEIANYVLAHLSGAKIEDDVISFEKEKYDFSEKEKSIICYLSGYVVGTFYRRIRFSPSSKDDLYHQQCLSILLAAKSNEDESVQADDKLVNIMNRGGLWKVTPEVVKIFENVESTFQTFTKQCVTKIDSKEIVKNLMQNSGIQANFTKVVDASTENVKKEVALNLLQDLLMLYVRTRTFSFVKDKQQLYKIKSDATKSKSLRNELKKKTSSMEQGH